jgi:hypothetical protein
MLVPTLLVCTPCFLPSSSSCNNSFPFPFPLSPLDAHSDKKAPDNDADITSSPCKGGRLHWVCCDARHLLAWLVPTLFRPNVSSICHRHWHASWHVQSCLYVTTVISALPEWMSHIPMQCGHVLHASHSRQWAGMTGVCAQHWVVARCWLWLVLLMQRSCVLVCKVGWLHHT